MVTKVKGSVFDSDSNNLVTNVKDFGAVGDGVADDTLAIQAAIDSLTTGGVLYFSKGTYKLTGLAVAVDDIELTGNATLTFPVLGASAGITVTSNNFSVTGQLKFTGPLDDVYVANEIAIQINGTSAVNRGTGVYISGCEFSGFGGYSIQATFMDNIVVERCYSHNIGGAGYTFFSCNDGKFLHNKIVSVALNNGGNAYGISLTHDSTLWPGDMTTSPYCRDWLVDGNWIEDINWEAIDTHGCERITVVNNRIYNTYGGIAVTTSSNNAIGYAGESNIIAHNLIDARNPDGTLSGRENVNYGITVNGGIITQNDGVAITGNILKYQGTINNGNSGAIQATYTRNLALTGNVIEHWGGNGINLNFSDDALVNGNNIASHAATEVGGWAITQSVTDAHKLTITGNVLDSPNESINCKSTVPPVVSGNDFKGSTQLLRLTTAGDYSTGDISINSEINTSDSTTIDVSKKPDVSVIGIFYSTPITITNLTGARAGQIVTLVIYGGNAVTFDRSNARLDGATNFVGNQYDTITLYQSGSEWYELSRSVNG